MSEVPSEKPATQLADNPGSDPVSAEPSGKAGNARRWTKLGVGAAIGSAAIAAALLYANRSNRNDRS